MSNQYNIFFLHIYANEHDLGLCQYKFMFYQPPYYNGDWGVNGGYCCVIVVIQYTLQEYVYQVRIWIRHVIEVHTQPQHKTVTPPPPFLPHPIKFHLNFDKHQIIADTIT